MKRGTGCICISNPHSDPLFLRKRERERTICICNELVASLVNFLHVQICTPNSIPESERKICTFSLFNVQYLPSVVVMKGPQSCTPCIANNACLDSPPIFIFPKIAQNGFYQDGVGSEVVYIGHILKATHIQKAPSPELW